MQGRKFWLLPHWCLTISVKKYKNHLIFIDLAIFAKISRHKNVLKLTGCCLETRFPTLVFDFVKGTLASQIDAFNFDSIPLHIVSTWCGRACYIAHAVAYIHIVSTRPISHRDIKPTIILFDQHDIPKLSAFELAISIPEGETYLDDRLVGTLGSACPNYIMMSCITKKTNVYGFGVLLLGLLIGPPL